MPSSRHKEDHVLSRTMKALVVAMAVMTCGPVAWAEEEAPKGGIKDGIPGGISGTVGFFSD